MNRNTYKLAALTLALAFASLPQAVVAQDADEIMALTRAQWAAEDHNKPASEAWASVADDYTEFNPGVPVLVEGKALSGRFYEANRQSGETGMVSEMLNPHVQFYGDTAILAYNFAGVTKDKDGKMKPNLAKSTRVYVKQGGKWMLVHANFAPVTVPD
ncbi:MAG: DUF4440 domain-containing protein [Lysobacterales bacterium]